MSPDTQQLPASLHIQRHTHSCCVLQNKNTLPNIQPKTKCHVIDACIDSTEAHLFSLSSAFIPDPDITNAVASEEKPDYVL